MKKLVNVTTLTHKEWLEWRKKGIGGSDAGAICGMNKYRSPIAVYLDKTADEVVEKPMNEAMRLGQDFEDYVKRRWMEETGKKAVRENYMLQHDDYPWMLADIDRRVVGENAGLECKTCSPYAAGKWENNGIPPEYVIQCLHYMAVTGAERWYLACLIYQRGMEYRVIERDDNVIDALIQVEKAFWTENVMKREMPAPDGSVAADDALAAAYAESDPNVETVDITDMTLGRYDEINALIDDLSAEKKEIEQRIKTEMKSAEKAYLGERTISWKSYPGRESVDTKRLKKDHPDLFEKYKKVGKPYRRFTISKAPTD